MRLTGCGPDYYAIVRKQIGHVASSIYTTNTTGLQGSIGWTVGLQEESREGQDHAPGQGVAPVSQGQAQLHKELQRAAVISTFVVQEEAGKGKSGAQDKALRKEGGRLTKLQEDLERLEARQAFRHVMHVQQTMICAAPWACHVCYVEPGCCGGLHSLL